MSREQQPADLVAFVEKNIKGGLSSLYRTLELTCANPLKDAHATLDSAVTAPGVPNDRQTLKALVTGDCIRLSGGNGR